MTPFQIETLCETIEKEWIPIVENGRGSPVVTECTLCINFYNCDGCPISQFTGDPNCWGTPLYAWLEAVELKLFNVQELAIRELLFLVALLPGQPTYEQLCEQVGV